MLKVNSFFNTIFSRSEKKKLAEFQRTVQLINDLEPEIEKLSQDMLLKRISEIKSEISNGKKIDDYLVESFAMVREASKRTLGQRHFDVQLIGGMVLHNGGISEMKTGEGKTLVSTLAAFLNSLSGKGVHIVTVNDYLARRDAEWMGSIFNYLGLSVGCLTNDTEGREKRKEQYACDITYGTNNEFGFDYLRDNLRVLKQNIVQRDHNFCIVDEVDSILIDESRTPLVISGAIEDKTTLYNSINKIIPFLNDDDFEIDEKTKTANLTDAGNDKAEKILKERNIISEGTLYDISNVAVVHHINQALRANKLFEKDRDYIVKSGSVVIVDEFTGRTMEGRRYGDGLHQAIEAKENVKVQNESQTLASITYQNYFRLYNKISGMTGTALTEAEEFGDIYNLSVFEIPTNIPVSRIDNEDEIYRTAEEKYDAIIEQIKICNEKSQPVLVGTTSIDKSEKISKKLRNNKIKHEVLNAKHHEQEAKIIANAGEPGAVTIATNMAGRGTDIQLGGNFEFNSSTKNGQENLEGLKDTITQKKDEVIKAGGLFVIGSERHESRRIDNQLRGRSGRQGDPGETKFFISLEDDLMRIFGSEKIDSVLKSLGLKEGESIKHAWISKALERAQKKVEGRNFDIRKTLLKFDDVLNDQRKTIFEQRLELMNADNISEIANEMQYDVADEIVERYCPEKSYADQWNLQDLQDEINQYFSKKIDVNLENSEGDINQQYIKDKVYTLINENTVNRKGNHSEEEVNSAERMVMLKILDDKWKDHINNLEQLRSTIGLRGYGQRDPLNEYKNEAFGLFEELINNLKIDVSKIFSRMRLREKQNQTLNENSVSEKINQSAIKTKKISRNAPCPCGSGKKYKHCCGKIN
ncbi:MAG: protein translocase subunit SecA [Candidatus Pelagibacterales bacterium]|jgi:preprotein translocase subunit SecA|nr:MAG: protein translocase subunit SecA [Pelagibacterales bacterium]|tara:strand:- start:704 stop:3307 length:2604 start_codon:yes stop_codon:yes gene_type:complete